MTPSPTGQQDSTQFINKRLDQVQQSVVSLDPPTESSSETLAQVRQLSGLVSKVRADVELSKSQLLDVRTEIAKWSSVQQQQHDQKNLRADHTRQQLAKLTQSLDHVRASSTEMLENNRRAIEKNLFKELSRIQSEFGGHASGMKSTIDNLQSQFRTLQETLGTTTAQLDDLGKAIKNDDTLNQLRSDLSRFTANQKNLTTER